MGKQVTNSARPTLLMGAMFVKSVIIQQATTTLIASLPNAPLVTMPPCLEHVLRLMGVQSVPPEHSLQEEIQLYASTWSVQQENKPAYKVQLIIQRVVRVVLLVHNLTGVQ